MSITIEEFDNLLYCENLLPNSIFCGSDEYLPGIQKGYLPNKIKKHEVDL